MATVIVDVSGYVWKRLIYNGEYMPEWFYTGTDGDYTTAINQAIVTAENKTVVFTIGKTYNVTSVKIHNAVTLAGFGTLKKIVDAETLATTDNSPVIAIEPINNGTTITAVQNVMIQDITIDGNKADIIILENDPAVIFPANPEFCGITAISLNNAATAAIINKVQVNNVTIKDTYSEAVKTQCCSGLYIQNSNIINCQQRSSTGFNNSAISIRAELTDAVKNFQNIVVADCTFDQIDAQNGCINISATNSNTVKQIQLLNNICNMGDYKVDGPDTVNITGIQCSTATNGVILNLLIDGNLINGFEPIDEHEAKYHNCGISLNGKSGTAVAEFNGIASAVISNNIIKTCKLLGIEIVGKHITAIGNELYNCGYIVVNANNVKGGMTGIKIAGNTIKANIGYTDVYATFFGGLLIQAETENMHGTLVDGNIFEGINPNSCCTNKNADFIHIQTGTTTAVYNLNIVNNNFLNIIKHGINIDNTVNAEGVNIANNIFKYYPGIANPEQTTLPYYGIISSARSLKNLSISNNTFICSTNNVTNNFITNLNAINIAENGSTPLSIYSNLSITNNNIYSTEKGILVTSPVNGLIITQNLFDISTTPLTFDVDCANVILTGNIFKIVTTIPANYENLTYLNTVVIVDQVASGTVGLAYLNEHYGNVAIGQTITCPNKNFFYKKTGAGQWVSGAISNVT
jgi:hypothetical protein